MLKELILIRKVKKMDRKTIDNCVEILNDIRRTEVEGEINHEQAQKYINAERKFMETGEY